MTLRGFYEPVFFGNQVREKREHHRAEFVVPVQITVDTDGEVLDGETRDVSVGGIYLVALKNPPIGAPVRLSLELPGLGKVELPGFVRWTKQEGFGVQFGLLGAHATHALGRLCRAGSNPALSAG